MLVFQGMFIKGRAMRCSLYALFALLLMGIGCEDGSDPDASVPDASVPDCNVEATMASLEAEYFGTSCTFSSCHSGVTPAGGLLLMEGEAHEALFSVTPQNEDAAAAGLVLVDPGNPDGSYLLMMVEGMQGDMGQIMPPGAPEPVDPQCRIAALREWIALGASPQ